MWRKSVLETVPGIGHKALQACLERIHATHELVLMLRRNNRLGEKLYWIIYVSYMTDRQPGDVVEILDELAQKHGRIPRSTYFRLRERAIKLLDVYIEEMIEANTAFSCLPESA
jgi:hypothetical protein